MKTPADERADKRAFYAMLRENGLCVRCQNPAEPGKSLCLFHLNEVAFAYAPTKTRGHCSECDEAGHNARTCARRKLLTP